MVRAADFRTKFETQYQALVGFRDVSVNAGGRPRWWTRLVLPDITALSWGPAAFAHLSRIIRTDRPDAVLTTSPSESSHLLGVVARRATAEVGC